MNRCIWCFAAAAFDAGRYFYRDMCILALPSSNIDVGNRPQVKVSLIGFWQRFGLFCALCVGTGSFAGSAAADTFGSGPNSFQIDFVTIGNPGNATDMTGSPKPAGSVSYVYRIAKYEVPEHAIDKANILGSLSITKDIRGPNKPATEVTWIEAVKFVNWLNTTSGSPAAYKFGAAGKFQLWQPIDPGYDPNNLFRNRLAAYFLPSVDEWYKAAYYDPTSGTYFDYPTASNNLPTAVSSGTSAGTAVYQQSFATGPADVTSAGGLSAYGTMAQGGNVTEWEETEFDLVNDMPNSDRGRRGGAWNNVGVALQSPDRGWFSTSWPSPLSLGTTGFRVASIVPEPGMVMLAATCALTLLACRKRPLQQFRSSRMQNS